MKTLIIVVALLLPSAVVPAAQTANPAPTAWQVASHDANSRVWQQQTYEPGPNGKVHTHVHHYTELATGMYYQDANGQWQESQDEIDAYAQGAISQKGQYQVIYANNLNSAGSIDQQTPDGKRLRSNILGLAYHDTSSGNDVLIAQVQDSTGQLISANQVLYPNAFSGVNADVRYTYKKGSFEQDVILREQPPTPESLGLNSATTEIEVMTEFLNPPQETIKEHMGRNGTEPDQDISWGAMRIGPGKAFDLGEQPNYRAHVVVTKQYTTVQGRKILFEKVPLSAIQSSLQSLPPHASIKSRLLKTASKQLVLPKPLLAQAAGKPIKLAASSPASRGYVLDYVELSADPVNYTFQADTTYYISDYCNLWGTSIFEGGTILKYGTNGGLNIIEDSIAFETGPYRPAIFTSINDNTVGETITGSSGTPSVEDVQFFLIQDTTNNLVFRGCRFSYAILALIYASDSSDTEWDFWDCQFTMNCCAILPNNLCLHNVLISTSTNNPYNSPDIYLQGSILEGEHVTADQGYGLVELDDGVTNYVSLTNCLITGQPMINYVGNPYIVTSNDTVWLPTVTEPVYQTVGGGSYYLATNSPYRNTGTTNIDPAALADIATKTTWPPVVYDGVSFTNPTTLSPQAPRDTNSSPDLGYHYDPLDYVFGGCDLYTNLTFTAGTAVGWFQDHGGVSSSGQPYGISLNDGANLASTGNATQPNWISHFLYVQEGGNGAWDNRGWMSGIMVNGSGSPPVPQLNAQFTKWSAVPGLAGFYRDNWAYGQIHVAHSEYYGTGMGSVAGYMSMYYTNCLFYRGYIVFDSQYQAASFTFDDCTFYNGLLSAARFSGQAASYWMVENTAFDGTAFQWDDNYNGTSHTTFDYNAYNTNNLSWETYPYPYPVVTNTLEVVGPHDITNLTTFNWQSSWFGDFYLSTNSPLIQAGSTMADQVGLYHFTTQTNQVPETNSIVDIGYHYVATDAYGNPLDSNGDGIPDYLENAGGNGLVNPGETDWALAILVQPANQTAIQGSNATFTVTADGVAPLAYQWLFNATNLLAGATNAFLTLTNIQSTNVGFYSVVVTNLLGGSMTSSPAALTMLYAPTITGQPVSQVAILANDIIFSVVATGYPLPTYQWYFNGTAIADATKTTLELDNVASNNIGNYQVVVSNSLGSVTSETASLTSVEAPYDYVVMSGSWTNFDFQSDTTYYVDSTVELYGTTTIEGGTAIKYGNHPASQLVLNGPLNCLTTTYRPALLTSRDDHSIGSYISQTSTIQTNYNAIYLVDAGGQTNAYHNLRIKYAGTGILGANPMDVWDSQFVLCGTAVGNSAGGTIALHNILISQVTNCVATTNEITAEFLTADKCQAFCQSTNAGANLTNSILTAVANTNGVNLVVGVSLASGSGVYQVAGGGDYYLATNTYQGQGISAINPLALADVAGKTTWPPVIYNVPGSCLSTNLNLYPQAARDTNSSPDLGYHYDPLDYVFGEIYVTNATITINAGTAVGLYSTSNISEFGYEWFGLAISDNASLVCLGLANSLVHIVQYNTVQENDPGWIPPYEGGIFQYDGNNCSITCKFTDWSGMVQDVAHFNVQGGGGVNIGPFNFQDCQFHGGQMMSGYPTVNFTNCLLERVNADIEPSDTNIPVFLNNTVYGGTFGYVSWNVTNAVINNNLFDHASIPDWFGALEQTYAGGYNAYVTNCDTLDPLYTNDVILSNSTAYQTSWFGSYYLPPGSPLINAGSTTADQLGLYHFTTQTNQVPETNSIVDIGYHYVATDAYGNPLDSNGDGIPDYLEDLNGDGLFDGNDLFDWRSPIYRDGTLTFTNGLNINIFEPRPRSYIP